MKAYEINMHCTTRVKMKVVAESKAMAQIIALKLYNDWGVHSQSVEETEDHAPQVYWVTETNE